MEKYLSYSTMQHEQPEALPAAHHVADVPSHPPPRRFWTIVCSGLHAFLLQCSFPLKWPWASSQLPQRTGPREDLNHFGPDLWTLWTLVWQSLPDDDKRNVTATCRLVGRGWGR